RIYADHGFFTADSQLTSELHEVFRALFEPRYQPPAFQKLLVAQYNMREAFEGLIEQEIQAAQAGKAAQILIKLNNLEDKGMIDHLYRASQAGVQIRLLIRGICCLRPGVAGLSENIQVVRIVDQFLEHARAFVFHQGGKKRLYLASSDWMSRNLNRRIEVGFPILSEALKAEIFEILELQWADSVKGVYLDANLHNIPREVQSPAIRSQVEVYRRMEANQLVARNFNSKQ
ncbi:MAG: polyphosphate kinase 1, partial [Bacteroidota bacterium]